MEDSSLSPTSSQRLAALLQESSSDESENEEERIADSLNDAAEGTESETAPIIVIDYVSVASGEMSSCSLTVCLCICLCVVWSGYNIRNALPAAFSPNASLCGILRRSGRINVA